MTLEETDSGAPIRTKMAPKNERVIRPAPMIFLLRYQGARSMLRQCAVKKTEKRLHHDVTAVALWTAKSVIKNAVKFVSDVGITIALAVGLVTSAVSRTKPLAL